LTTEVALKDAQVWAFFIDAIRYLERNDFTDISQIGLRLLCAKDGKQSVYFWLDSTSENHAIPVKLIKMAHDRGSRIDIITIENRTGLLMHHMNAVEA
jgi:hypothetical protein